MEREEIKWMSLSEPWGEYKVFSVSVSTHMDMSVFICRYFLFLSENWEMRLCRGC